MKARAAMAIAIAIASVACAPTDGLSRGEGEGEGEGARTGTGEVRAAACAASAFEGTFDVDDVAVTGDEGACVTIAREMSSTGRPPSLTLTRIDADVLELRSGPDDAKPTRYTRDASGCVLTRSDTGTAAAPDANRRPVTIALRTLGRLTLNGDRLNGTSTSDVDTTTAGASGFPCKLSARLAATRR